MNTYPRSLWFFALIIGAMSLSTCSKPAEKVKPELAARKKIDSLEALLKTGAGTMAEADYIELGMVAASAYQYYAIDFPNDSLAPEFQMRRARVFESILNAPDRAGQIYDEVYQRYENFPARPMSLFYAGSAYHDAGDTSKAISALKTFGEKYPKHPFATQAIDLIKFIRSVPDIKRDSTSFKQYLQVTPQ